MDIHKILTEPLTASPTRKMITLRVDEDVAAWLRSFGFGYQLRVNALLRNCMAEFIQQNPHGAILNGSVSPEQRR